MLSAVKGLFFVQLSKISKMIQVPSIGNVEVWEEDLLWWLMHNLYIIYLFFSAELNIWALILNDWKLLRQCKRWALKLTSSASSCGFTSVRVQNGDAEQLNIWCISCNLFTLRMCYECWGWQLELFVITSIFLIGGLNAATVSKQSYLMLTSFKAALLRINVLPLDSSASGKVKLKMLNDSKCQMCLPWGYCHRVHEVEMFDYFSGG